MQFQICLKVGEWQLGWPAPVVSEWRRVHWIHLTLVQWLYNQHLHFYYVTLTWTFIINPAVIKKLFNSNVLKLCVFLAITNQYPQFYHATLSAIFINNPITALQNLYNSYGILNKHECVKLKCSSGNCLFTISTSSDVVQAFTFYKKDCKYKNQCFFLSGIC